MKKTYAITTGVLGAVLCFAAPADAGLFGAGRTVQAFFYNGTLASPAGLIADGASTSDPVSLAAAVTFSANVSETAIGINDTTITIRNLLSGAPFCVANTPGTACVDQIDGFDFLFTGENILGVSVDPASAVGMLPVSGTFQGHTHQGLQLLSNNEIRIDLTGDLPLLNDTLILDLTFAASTVPEPGTLALLCLGLAGLGFARRRESH